MNDPDIYIPSAWLFLPTSAARCTTVLQEKNTELPGKVREYVEGFQTPFDDSLFQLLKGDHLHLPEDNKVFNFSDNKEVWNITMKIKIGKWLSVLLQLECSWRQEILRHTDSEILTQAISGVSEIIFSPHTVHRAQWTTVPSRPQLRVGSLFWTPRRLSQESSFSGKTLSFPLPGVSFPLLSVFPPCRAHLINGMTWLCSYFY